MRRIIPGFLALVWASAGWAASNLHFGPPPQWVKPTPLPAPSAATQAAIKIRLIDHQIELTPRTITHYSESLVRVQTPQGLSTMGTITLAWDPDTDVLTVHKVHILRGDKVIDVLGSGQTFTIAKRETNLDYATLDDTLTAILQPADLQVGDALDVAYTIERTDPVLAGASADEAEISPEVPIDELHFSALWPSAYPVKWLPSEGLTGIRQTHEGGDMSGVTLSMSDVQPILEPKEAPPRLLLDRRIDFSGAGSWQDVAKLFAPLYEHAARLSSSSPLQAEIARIRAATADPKARAALALALVEDKVRYVLLAMNNGGLVPADADQTWARRYGDCKAKSVLLLALLHGLGIEARPVAVNTRAGDGMDARLPMGQLFDHVLVEATIDGQTYWLDGTRLGDVSLDHLQVPYYHWGLPLVAQGAQLVKMIPAPLASPITQTTISVDASAGVARPVPFHVEVALHDDSAIVTQQRLANLTPQQVDTGLRGFWSRQYDFVTIQSVAATYDEKSATERLTMDGTARLDWSGGQYAPVGLGVGYDANFERQPGPHHDAPFLVPYPIYDSNTVTIKLPNGGKGFGVSGADDVDKTLAGIEYQRHAKIDGGVFTAVASTRSVAPEFPAAVAAAAQQSLRDLAKTTLDVDAPAGHTPTAAEIAAGMPAHPSTVADYGRSAYLLLRRRDFAAASEDLSAALALDSANALILAERGMGHAWQGDTTSAQSDFAAALASDPHNSAALDGRGWLDIATGENSRAISEFSAAIQAHPQDAYALRNRALLYWRLGKSDEAIADLDAAIRQTPKESGLYWMRALILAQQNRRAEAAAQANLAIAANPKAPNPYLVAGSIYLSCHEPAKAAAAFEQAVKIAPNAPTYLARAAYRPWTDLAERRTDIESALKLEPESVTALSMLADVQMAAGQYSDAVTSLTSALDKRKDAFYILTERGIAYTKSGQRALAQADLGKALTLAKLPGELNNLCWALATANVSLASALDDCNAALTKDPTLTAALDSRGFVLLRLGRYEQAIAAYDSALKLDPLEADSLYGRGICELRTGKRRRGQSDIRAATAVSFAVAGEFTHYGVQP